MLTIKESCEILGVSSDVSLQDLKQAYRDLIKVWHPDRFQGDERVVRLGETQVKQINEAYEVLSAHTKTTQTEAPTTDNTSIRVRTSWDQLLEDELLLAESLFRSVTEAFSARILCQNAGIEVPGESLLLDEEGPARWLLKESERLGEFLESEGLDAEAAPQLTFVCDEAGLIKQEYMNDVVSTDALSYLITYRLLSTVLGYRVLAIMNEVDPGTSSTTFAPMLDNMERTARTQIKQLKARGILPHQHSVLTAHVPDAGLQILDKLHTSTQGSVEDPVSNAADIESAMKEAAPYLEQALRKLEECKSYLEAHHTRNTEAGEEGLKAINEAVRICPLFAGYWNVRGLLLWDGLGKKEEALASLRKALELDPTAHAARENIQKIERICFVATVLYSSESAWQTTVLRDFRDSMLMRLPSGRTLVAWYYESGPALAHHVGQYPRPIISSLRLAANLLVVCLYCIGCRRTE